MEASPLMINQQLSNRELHVRIAGLQSHRMHTINEHKVAHKLIFVRRSRFDLHLHHLAVHLPACFLA